MYVSGIRYDHVATTDCIKSDLPMYMFKQAGQYNSTEYWYVIFLYKVISSESQADYLTNRGPIKFSSSIAHNSKYY